ALEYPERPFYIWQKPGRRSGGLAMVVVLISFSEPPGGPVKLTIGQPRFGYLPLMSSNLADLQITGHFKNVSLV
ncbi:hypothetical protein, partial [Spirosoma jeollabukense]